MSTALNNENNKTDIKKSVSLDEINKDLDKLQVEKYLLLDKYMNSTDPEQIIKASNELDKEMVKIKEDRRKSYIFSPENELYTGLGYKSSPKSITYDLLRGVAKIPIVNMIISTRLEQLSNFTKFTTDTQKEGWTVRKKLGRFDDMKGYKITNEDKREIEKIATFIENGGLAAKWERSDDFDDFLLKRGRDRLELDQACFEVERNKRNEIIRYYNVDSATIRLLETIDPNNREKYKWDEVNGFLPIYGQVYNSQLLKNKLTNEYVVFYPWELSFSVQNKTTNMRNNGYGVSELEILIETLTWLLWGMQYNGNFFKQGSSPRGFFTVKGNLGTKINEFRDAFRKMAMGVVNAHKVPIFEGDEVKWESMQDSNKDMEFSAWNELLMLLTCATYKMDPSELGFQFQKQNTLFGQQGQKERLDHSKEKGLKPLLISPQKQINKYIVSELNDKYEFVFTGIDLDDEGEILDNDIKKLTNGLLSLEDGFKKYNDRDFNPDKDTLLNQVYLQIKQAQMYGNPQSNEVVDGMYGEDENPFRNNDQESLFSEKSLANDPIMSQVKKHIEKVFNS